MDDRQTNEVEELKARFAALGDRVVENAKLLKTELQSELKRSVTDATGRLEQSAERISERVVSTVGEVRSNVEQTVTRVKSEINVVEAVRRQPAKAFGIAVGAGFLLAMLGGRRREPRALPPARVREEKREAHAKGAVKGGLVASLLTPLLLDFGKSTARGFLEQMMRGKFSHRT